MRENLAKISIFLLLALAACSPRGESGGTSTDVGGGGSGADALWRETVDEIEANLRLLVATPISIEPELFARLREDLPRAFREARVEFKEYPLIHGVELAQLDNPSRAPATGGECFRSAQAAANSRERDAINFPSARLIKVSRSRFSCYQPGSDPIRRLVLHEYLGLLGISETEEGRTHYAITDALLESFKVIHRFDYGLEVKLVRDCQEFQDMGVEGALLGDGLQTSVPHTLYRLANDIDCTGYPFREGKDDRHLMRSLQANVDGNGYAVRGLVFPLKQGEDLYTSAIFHTICSHCVIANVRFLDFTIVGDGGLLMRNAGTLRNIHFEGTVRPVHGMFRGIRSAREAGGFVRENLGVISNVNATLRVEGTVPPSDGVTSTWLGGFVGSNFGNISYVSGRFSMTGSGFLGGFAAYNAGSISNVHARVDIEGTGVIGVGGLVMANAGRIEHVLADGSIRLDEGREWNLYGPVEALAERQSVAGGIAAMIMPSAVDTSKPSPFSQFPFSIVDATANVSICGFSRFNLVSKFPMGSPLRAPLIGSLAGWRFGRNFSVSVLSGRIEGSVGFGEVRDTCSEEKTP